MIFPRRALFSKSKTILERITAAIPGKSLNSRSMSSEEDDVVFQEVGKNGVIILNRPKALNALNLSMVDKIYPTLLKWQNEKTLVLIKGAGDRAFCSGGDIRAVVQSGLKGGKLGYDFFRREYIMNGLIASYGIPYVALIDGITMGGGVGLSVHGTYRIATERTLFAMPESAIGLFADVGSSYVLSRLKGKLGWYLALTGTRLKGSDVLRAGIATHYCESSRLADLEQVILKCMDATSLDNLLNKVCVDPNKLPEFSLNPYLEKIDQYFSVNSVEEILEKLKQDDSDWAKETLKIFHQVSPTSVKLTFRELNLAREKNLQECLQMEYALAVGCLTHHDFYEGNIWRRFDNKFVPSSGEQREAELTS